MNTYLSDRWVIVKISSDKNTHYRVFASWIGGYLNGDSWKLSSGCEKMTMTDEGDYCILQNSGSNYVLVPYGYGMTGYTTTVILGFQSHFEEENKDQNGKMEILSEKDSLAYIQTLK